MISVTVKLFATLREFSPGAKDVSTFNVQVEEGTTIGQLVSSLGIPKEAIRVAFRNGVVSDDTTPLSEGDEVGFFPPIAGGGISVL